MGKPSKLRRKARRRAEYAAFRQELQEMRVIIRCGERRCTNEMVMFQGARGWCEIHAPKWFSEKFPPRPTDTEEEK